MSAELDEVPELRGPRPTGARPVTRTAPGPPPALTRRSVLGGLLASGTALGFTALGVFPPARRAYAGVYDIHTGPCPDYASDDNCSPGCGPSMVFPNACATSGEHRGFHRKDGPTWALQPNNCLPGGWDGWLWYYGAACGSCACFIEFRCHDGFKRTDSGWVKSICRWTVRCGCPEDTEPEPEPEPDLEPEPVPQPPADEPPAASGDGSGGASGDNTGDTDDTEDTGDDDDNDDDDNGGLLPFLPLSRRRSRFLP